MNTLRAATWSFTAIFLGCQTAHAAPLPDEEPFVVETANTEKVDAFRGSFSVPENRATPNSRRLTLRYVRLPALGAAQGPPIIYLAGGPGASGIDAINYRYTMFRAMRKYGDVIALDQRGTGASNDVPTCTSAEVLATDRVTSEHHRAVHDRAADR